MITGLFERLIIGIVAGVIAFLGSYRVLETDVVILRQNMAEIQSQRIERRALIERDRMAVINAIQRVDDRLGRIEDCIRVRTCTK